MDRGACITVKDSHIPVIIPEGIGKDIIVKTLAQIAATVESDGEANTPDVFMADVLISAGTEVLSIIKTEYAQSLLAE